MRSWGLLLLAFGVACGSTTSSAPSEGPDAGLGLELDGFVQDAEADTADAQTELVLEPQCETDLDCLPPGEVPACTHWACDQTTWQCVSGPVKDFTACEDGNACTADDVCLAGSCEQGTAVLCDDGNVCTDDSCDEVAGCVFIANAAGCDDADGCTVDDQCQAGQCAGGVALDCEDDDACTDDGCDVAQGCTHTAVDCDDGDACTDDGCESQGGCAWEPLTCQDDDVCTDDTCDMQQGCVFEAVVCDDGDACTTDWCKPDVGCVTEPACIDGDPCTTDDCGVEGCVFLPFEGPCDDGDPCTANDVCASGAWPCGDLPGVAAEEVLLHYVAHLGDEIRVGYTKNFATCGHVKDLSGALQHVANWFCAADACTHKVLGPEDMTVFVGQQVRMCHGNNGSVCSEWVTVVGEPPGLACAGEPVCD